MAFEREGGYTSSIGADADTIEGEHDEGRVKAASYLTILNTELPPAELERLVGFAGDETWKEGDRKGRAAAYNGLNFESGLDEHAPPWRHFVALLGRLGPYAAQIASVADLPSTHSARIWIVEHTERDMIDTIIEPEHVAVAASMHVELAFSSYFYGDWED